MREHAPARNPDVRPRPGAAVWLTLAALLSLCLSQPLHASTNLASASGQASIVAAGGALAAQHAAHDADHCSLCRATAQARLGVRPSACVADLAAAGACLPLPLPTPEIACCAPDLRGSPPRAPPLAPVLVA